MGGAAVLFPFVRYSGLLNPEADQQAVSMIAFAACYTKTR